MNLNEFGDARSDAYGDDGSVYLKQGWDVFGSSGEKIGEVAETADTFFVVSKGFFFPTDRYVPYSAISRVDGEKIYLSP